MNNNPRSFARTTIALKLLTLVLVAFQAGCQVPWKVPTRYTITDIRDDATQTELRSALSRYGYSNEVNSPEFAFTLTKVETVSDLKKVQQTIQEISKRSRVPVQFNRATLDFRSVFGQGTSDIHLKGDATIGARVWLDTGEPEVIAAEVNGEGAWSANISRTVKLRDRGGWVYGAFEKDGVKQFMKINVLDTSSSTKIREEDLPSDSVLRKR